MSVRNIAVLVGSLRHGALSRKFADALPELAPDGLRFEVVEIGDLPLYNQDLDTDAPPAAWTRFRDQLRDKDGVIFITPEFNRGLPAALKNAIDVGSRPYGSSVFAGKPAAVISQSPGALGGYGANHQLRQSLVFLDMPVVQQPEIYLGRSHEAFDDEGRIVAEPVRELLANLLGAYARLIDAKAPLRAAA